jgi:integrase/recombinase XerD
MAPIPTSGDVEGVPPGINREHGVGDSARGGAAERRAGGNDGGAPSASEAGLLRRFLDYLYLERNLSSNTIASYRTDLRLFFSYLEAARMEARSADQSTLLDYLSFCRGSGLSHRTISRYLSSLRAFYRHLVDEGVVHKDPTLNIGAPKMVRNPPEYLTLEEVERLLAAPEEGTVLGLRDRTIIELMYSCGLRVSEVSELKVSSVSVEEKCLLVFGKGRKERVVPFGAKAENLLGRYVGWARGSLLRGRRMDSLFLNFRGEPLGRKGIWKIIKGYARASGIEKNIKPHLLRHSFGAHLIQNGADLRTVQELLGHSDISTTQIYTHLDRGTLIDVHRKCHPLGDLRKSD